MKPNVICLALLMVLMPVAGCGPGEQAPAAQNKPHPVRTQEIVNQDLPVLVHAVGRLLPDREVILSTQVTGIVSRISADVGDAVVSGQILVKLDPVDYALALNQVNANLQSARAQLKTAENSYARAKRLLPEKAITPELYEAAEAGFLVAKAQVAQLEAAVAIAGQRLDKTVIKAPFDGHITAKMVEIGQNLSVGAPVMGLADMKTMRVRIHINENDYVHLDKQDPVTATVEAYPDIPFDGRVDKIGIQADARTNTFEIDILLDNPRFLLKAGLTARVSIQTKLIAEAVVIPQNSVLFRQNRKEVFVVQGGRAAPRTVALGRVEGSAFQVLEGLAPGDQLVVSGAQYLKDGDKVTVLE